MGETTETNQTYISFVTEVQEFLRDNEANSPQKTCFSGKIIDAVGQKMGGKIARNSMGNYLNHAARKDIYSGILSAGPAKGYYLNDKTQKIVEEIAKNEKIDEEKEEKINRIKVSKEKSIYNVLRQWLLSQDFLAKITADERGGPKWSNPDIIGIKIIEHFGITDIEITSIEAKISITNWRQDIFEAISHKRFANRVYFAYPVTVGTEKIDDEMRRYCDMYRIGIITIEMNEDQYKSIHTAKKYEEIQQIDDVSLVDDRVPAPYDFVPPRFQIEFLGQLGIEKKQDLYRFGADNE